MITSFVLFLAPFFSTPDLICAHVVVVFTTGAIEFAFCDKFAATKRKTTTMVATRCVFDSIDGFAIDKCILCVTNGTISNEKLLRDFH